MKHAVEAALREALYQTSGRIFETPAGFLIGWGTTAGNGVEGWAPSAIFFDVDGVLYENKGTKTTASWKAVTTAA